MYTSGARLGASRPRLAGLGGSVFHFLPNLAQGKNNVEAMSTELGLTWADLVRYFVMRLVAHQRTTTWSRGRLRRAPGQRGRARLGKNAFKEESTEGERRLSAADWMIAPPDLGERRLPTRACANAMQSRTTHGSERRQSKNKKPCPMFANVCLTPGIPRARARRMARAAFQNGN